MAATVQVKCRNKNCNTIFTARVADRQRGCGLFCSKGCKAVVQTVKTGVRGPMRDESRQEEVDYGSDGWDEHKDWI